MFTRVFWLAAGERAVKTVAQTLVATLGVDAATSIVDLDWPYAFGVAGTAGVLSLLTSVASDRVGVHDGPSLTTEQVVGRHQTVTW